MIKEILGWVSAALVIIIAFILAGFVGGVAFGLLTSAFNIGVLLWQ